MLAFRRTSQLSVAFQLHVFLNSVCYGRYILYPTCDLFDCLSDSIYIIVLSTYSLFGSLTQNPFNPFYWISSICAWWSVKMWSRISLSSFLCRTASSSCSEGLFSHLCSQHHPRLWEKPCILGSNFILFWLCQHHLRWRFTYSLKTLSIRALCLAFFKNDWNDCNVAKL